MIERCARDNNGVCVISFEFLYEEPQQTSMFDSCRRDKYAGFMKEIRLNVTNVGFASQGKLGSDGIQVEHGWSNFCIAQLRDLFQATEKI